MNFDEALGAELNAIPELTDKVLPLNAPDGTKAPYLLYDSSEGIQDKTLDGYLSTREVVCGINIYHNTYKELKALTKTVLSTIISFQGRIIGDNGPLIKNVTYEKPDEFFNYELRCYVCFFDLKVRF